MELQAIWLLFSVGLGAATIEWATKTLARIHPSSYFGMTGVILGFDRRVSIAGFASRLIIPFLGGGIVGLLNPHAGEAAGAATGCYGALIAAWPALAQPHTLPQMVWDRMGVVKALLITYVLAFLLLGWSGATALQWLLTVSDLAFIFDWIKSTQVPDSTSILESVIGGILGFVLVSTVLRTINRLFGAN